MARTRSAETQLRSVTRELKNVRENHRRMMGERDAYRIRSTKAEQEAAEWKARFDLLLSKCKLSAEEA